MKKIICMILVMVMLLCLFAACDSNVEEMEWEYIILGHVLPKPQSSLMYCPFNDDDNLLVDIHKISQSEYFEYQRWCEHDKGFDIEKNLSGTSYDAYNKEGYRLSLGYNKKEEIMRISLDAPIPMESIAIPEWAIDAGLPEPSSKIGKFSWQYSDEFFLYVGEMPKEEYKRYKNACIDAGFTEDIYETDLLYTATTTTGYGLTLHYIGFDVITVEFQGPESESKKTEGLLDSVPTTEPTVEATQSVVVTEPTTETTTSTQPAVETTEPSTEATVSTEPTEITPAWEGVELKASDLSVTTKTDYAHTETDVIFLGKDEGVTITITTFVDGATADDLAIVYDKSLLSIKVSDKGEEENKIELYVTGKKTCETELAIFTAYELEMLGEEATCYLLDIRKLSSKEGRIVYVTSMGTKYHFSKSCAGDNATKTLYRDAKAYEYEACKKCAS